MRWVIAILTAAAALVAASNEVASLERFARERLHFPDGLSWTLPGMVTIATLAGALMWTLLRQVELRAAGRRLNVACALVSAIAVGLDHASGAVGDWIIPAGLVGALVPALATWLTHLLARMTADQSSTSEPQSGQQPAIPSTATAVPAGPPVATVGELVADRLETPAQPAESALETTTSVPTGDSNGDRWGPRLVAPLVYSATPTVDVAVDPTGDSAGDQLVTSEGSAGDDNSDPTGDAIDWDELVNRARPLVTSGAGSPALEKALGVNDYQARKLVRTLKPAKRQRGAR